MLIQFRVANYRSIRTPQTLSRVASSAKTELATHTSVCKSLAESRLLNSCAIYGANGAGKTSLMRAAFDLRQLVMLSAKADSDAELPVTPFLLSSSTAQKPSSFEVTFDLGGIRHQYGVVVSKTRVHEEWLIAYPLRHPQTLFHRTAKGDKYDWKWGDSLRGAKSKIAELTRKNVLFLSSAANLNHRQLTEVEHWFRSHFWVVNAEDLVQEFAFSSRLVATEQRERRKIESFLQSADIAIQSLRAEEITFSKSQLPSDMPRSVKHALTKELKGAKRFDIYAGHKTLEGGTIEFDLEEESHGTRKLFNLSGPIFRALRNGAAIFIDELDTGIHPVLAKALVGLFHDPKVNQHGAQLVVATHDTTLLNAATFRRDQIWLAEKDQTQSSHFYSLLEYQPRKEEALQRGYLAGRYGGIPVIRPLNA